MSAGRDPEKPQEVAEEERAGWGGSVNEFIC